jgi:hypothetical protein
MARKPWELDQYRRITRLRQWPQASYLRTMKRLWEVITRELRDAYEPLGMGERDNALEILDWSNVYRRTVVDGDAVEITFRIEPRRESPAKVRLKRSA